MGQAKLLRKTVEDHADFEYSANSFVLDIGKEIHGQQQQKGWGKSIVEVVASELKKEFPEVKGFSSRNLWNMRNFYVTYQADEKLQPIVAEISWTKNLVIMESFLSLNAVDAENGFTDFRFREIPIMQIMQKMAKRTLAVMDSSKIGRVSKKTVFSSRQLSTIVMDDHVGTTTKKLYEKNGIHIL